MPKADLGDVTIHYEEAGSGPAVYIFCHGLGSNSVSFVKTDFPFWSQYFRVVAWDNRGLGQSSQAAKYSLPLYAGDLARLMDHLGIEKALIHGVSWGGVVVQQFALDYPEKCAAIVIDSSSSEVNVAASENWYQRGEVVRLGKDARLTEFRPAFEGHTTSAQQMLESGVTVPPEHVESYVAQTRATASLREQPLTPRLKNITCPALIVAGGKDAVAGAGGSVIMARNMPNARLHILQDAGHGVYMQAPDEFRRLVLEFAKECGIL